MLIKTIPVGHLDTNCYIVTDEKTLKTAIIDPGADSNTILDYVESNGLTTEAIFLTHGHFDHIMALEAVMEATGAPAYINKRDAESGRKGRQSGLTAYFQDGVLQWYKTGDRINVGSLVFHIIETPGHSPGSVILQCENVLFTGDTLFRDSCGRTDLEGGDIDILKQSLKMITKLDGDYEVYPGHSESSTLERERRFNKYMLLAVDRQ